MKKEIIKKFSLKHCFHPLVFIKSRCNKINYLSHKFLFIPHTFFEINNYEIISRQLFIHPEKISRTKKLLLLKNFAVNLDKLKQYNIVHGDINFKNIVFTKKRIFLIDWEPILINKMNKKFILRSTFPYYSVTDLKNKKITRKTDLIAFLFLCERLFADKINLFNFSKLKNDSWLYPYTKINNKSFFRLSFIDIYKLVKSKYRN